MARDPCRIKFWGVPTKKSQVPLGTWTTCTCSHEHVQSSAFFVNFVKKKKKIGKSQTQITSLGLT